MKIVHVETVLSCGSYAGSAHWDETKNAIYEPRPTLPGGDC